MSSSSCDFSSLVHIQVDEFKDAFKITIGLVAKALNEYKDARKRATKGNKKKKKK